MAAPSNDPFAILGVANDVSEDELRRAYRRLAQRHHPDHNQGAPEAARRFEEIQTAYVRALELRRSGGGPGPQAPPAGGPASGDSGAASLDERIAAMERELAEARERAARVARAARKAAETAAAGESRTPRPTPEELGYVTTDDSLSKILDDAQAALVDRLEKAGDSPLVKRLADLLRPEDEA